MSNDDGYRLQNQGSYRQYPSSDNYRNGSSSYSGRYMSNDDDDSYQPRDYNYGRGGYRDNYMSSQRDSSYGYGRQSDRYDDDDDDDDDNGYGSRQGSRGYRNYRKRKTTVPTTTTTVATTTTCTTGTVTGRVYDDSTSSPAVGGTIKFTSTITAIISTVGYYTVALPVGTYSAAVVTTNGGTLTINITIKPCQTVTKDLTAKITAPAQS